jgi:hypothetical protein
MSSGPPASVAWILRIEAHALFVAGVIGYLQLNGHPIWAPAPAAGAGPIDGGYVRGPRLGAITYNLVHNLAIALSLLAVGWAAAIAPLALAGAILVAHVGMDRALGYGLKLPTDFRDTHLGRIGRG